MRSKKTILTFALLLACFPFNAVWAVDPIWQGDGTITEPYQIGTAAELVFLADNDEFYSDNFILTADIDLASSSPFSRAVIAPQGDEYDGIFDGNYHKIINLTIDAQTSNANYLGLFGETAENARIINLGLENITVIGGSSSNTIGTLAGWNNCETVTNCYARGSVSCGSGAFNVGGFIGVCQRGIINCFADVDVSGEPGSQRLGGFVGMNQGTYLNCYASGSVSGGSDVYGFAAYSISSYGFVNCYYLLLDVGELVDSYAEALTDIQMKNQSSFIGWDFFGETSNGMEETWMMDGYPALSWQFPVGLKEFSMLSNYWGQTGFTQDQPHSRVDWYVDGTVGIDDLALLAAKWLGPVVEKSYPLALDDDFETGDFTKQPWFLGSSPVDANSWVIDDVTVQQGAYSARSGTIGDIQSSYLELTVDTTGYDLITFYYKVSSENHFDFFHFYIGDGWRIEHGGDSGGWLYRTFPVYDGLTTFKWSYDKDSGGSDGEDCAWVDNIVFTKE